MRRSCCDAAILIPEQFLGTIFIDCSKLTDERIPTLKGKMKDWFDEACWHAPTLLVLDNLDRMLGAEVEVSSHPFELLRITC